MKTIRNAILLLAAGAAGGLAQQWEVGVAGGYRESPGNPVTAPGGTATTDRKSTRLNSSHLGISCAVFFLTKIGFSDETKVRDGGFFTGGAGVVVLAIR